MSLEKIILPIPVSVSEHCINTVLYKVAHNTSTTNPGTDVKQYHKWLFTHTLDNIQSILRLDFDLTFPCVHNIPYIHNKSKLTRWVSQRDCIHLRSDEEFMNTFNQNMKRIIDILNIAPVGMDTKITMISLELVCDGGSKMKEEVIACIARIYLSTGILKCVHFEDIRQFVVTQKSSLGLSSRTIRDMDMTINLYNSIPSTADDQDVLLHISLSDVGGDEEEKTMLESVEL